MIISQFIFTLFITVGFCLGLRIVTDKGQLLYFIRKPFENLSQLIKDKEELLKWTSDTEHLKAYDEIEVLKIKYYITKPLIICITCLASVWGLTWFILLNGSSVELIKYMVLNTFIASFIQTFIWNLYEKYL